MKTKIQLIGLFVAAMFVVISQSTIAQTATVAHSWQEYDVLKAAGNEVVMDMSVYSTEGLNKGLVCPRIGRTRDGQITWWWKFRRLQLLEANR